mgnify:CR=1 FL=1
MGPRAAGHDSGKIEVRWRQNEISRVKRRRGSGLELADHTFEVVGAYDRHLVSTCAMCDG